MTDNSGPRVAAIGGGHGLALALRAIRTYAGSITAVVNVADDGGSSGRLRREYPIPPPGDIRRALGALADTDAAWAEAFEHRFTSGELADHALGNLVLLGLAEVLQGDFTAALAEAGRLLGAVGTVLPATDDPVELRAEMQAGRIEPERIDSRDEQAHDTVVDGQVAVSTAPGRIRSVELVPARPTACPGAVRALEEAEQVVLAPGSLYTSVLPVLVVPGIADAVRHADGVVVQVANLSPQIPETEGLGLADHLRAVLDHGGRVDRFLYDPSGALAPDDDTVRDLGAEPVAAAVARPHGLAHDPDLLADALRRLC